MSDNENGFPKSQRIIISDVHEKLSEAMDSLSGPPFSDRREKARLYVAKALVELEAEYWKR